MKKYIESIMLMLLGMVVVTACSSDDDYQWATVSGEQVYFSNAIAAKQDIPMTGTSFNIPINRVMTDGPLTVNITMTDESGLFSAPSSVSFAAGEAQANIPISYDPTQLEYDDYKEITLAISSTEHTTEYGASSVKVKVGIPAPYTSIGKGELQDNYYFKKSTKVEIRRNDINPNVYRVMYPYKDITNGGSEYMEITLLQPGDNLRDVEITMNGLVYFSDTNTGYHHPDYDADIMLYHPATGFNGFDTEASWAYNRVLEYQEDGTPGLIQLAPFYYMDGVGGWNAANADGNLLIVFPGFTPSDYSMDFTYAGVLTTSSQEIFATGSLTLGADATNVKAVVVDASYDAEAVADAIAAGDLEATEVSAGNIRVPIAADLSGELQVIIVALDGTTVKNYASTKFEYYGGNNPWQSLGTGYFTDNLVITGYYKDSETKTIWEAQTYEVEILENTNQPGVYRMVNAYKGVAQDLDFDYADKNIDVNATDPTGVYIPVQATGVDDGDGMISIASVGGYLIGNYSIDELKAEGYLGTLENGVITFPYIDYKDSQGEVQFSYQGRFIQGSSAYTAGDSGELKVVLPEASQSAKAYAKRMARATSFEHRLKGIRKPMTRVNSKTVNNKILQRNLKLIAK